MWKLEMELGDSMTEKLKYKVGDKVLVEVEIAQIDGVGFPYKLKAADTFLSWFSEDGLDKAIVNLPPKPKVTQAMMEWYEEYENERADWRISDWLSDINTLEGMDEWLYGENHLHNQHALATLIAYGKEAVEVEKEKKYRVFIKGTSVYGDRKKLHYDEGNAFFATIDVLTSQDMFSKQKLDDIGFGGVFDNPMFEVEEVG